MIPCLISIFPIDWIYWLELSVDLQNYVLLWKKTKSNSCNMEKIAISLINHNYLSKYPWFMVSNSSLVTSILKSMSSITFSTWAKIWLLALSTFLTRPASLNNFAIALGFFRTSESRNEMPKYSLIFEEKRLLINPLHLLKPNT